MEKDLQLIEERRKEEWREGLRKELKTKDRLKIGRVIMPSVDPQIRNKNNSEVNLGLSDEQALEESKRCLDCVNPTCMDGCPVKIHIPSFIKNIERGDVLEAARVIRETSSLPGVCGRVCPQEKQCEAQCFYTVKMKKNPVAIGFLERYVADYERVAAEHSDDLVNHTDKKTVNNGVKIAVVGSGPASLSFAGDMAKYGYDVTVFEALHEIGGVLKYGIPEFRLPNDIVEYEINKLKSLGIRFETNCIVGKTISYEDLHEEGYKGIFVGSGAGLPRFMNVPGENLVGVMSSNEYLTRVNLMGAFDENSETPVSRGKHVAVIGGGNTAMDSVRTALRMGAERAMIVYRRSENEMPARLEEVQHAKEEGVEFFTLHNPIEFKGDEKGRLSSVLLQKMELGEPDASGRRKPIPVEGETVEIPIEEAIISVGVSPNPLIPRSFPGLSISKWGTIEVNESSQSDLPDVFAGGDIVRGGATVILAMGDGRNAAKGMHEHLSKTYLAH